MASVVFIFRFCVFLSFCLSPCLARKCELLKTSLTYSQENAPRDLSDVLPIIVEKVNRELEGVVDVEVVFTGGDMHDRVGGHNVNCSVTRLLSAVTSEKHRTMEFDEKRLDEMGRDVVTQCFQIEFSILDTDECKLPAGHAMRHKCPSPSICVNTLGSYECICPSSLHAMDMPKAADADFWNKIGKQDRSPWDLSLPSSSCPLLPSTYGCCDENAHGIEGSNCRASFYCPTDPCSVNGGNDCDSHAICKRAEYPQEKPNFICECIDGLMGNGHKCKTGIDLKPKPMVMYDGVTPTLETTQHGLYCGCSKPIVDPCSGFPKCEGKHEICTVTDKNIPMCACKPGFVKIEPFGCVDKTPPTLKLRNDPNGDGVTRLKQGDIYKEHAVDIVDENEEDYRRSLKITYSRPLPSGCIIDIGSFQVNYTVATPWTTPPYVRVTRTVVIEDIDECSLDVEKYETQCPELIPLCDIRSGAMCVNTIGSYTCKCPEFTTGDGFRHIASFVPDKAGNFFGVPSGYKGGNGCRDTSKPIIQLKGPNPKIFRTCQWTGLSGIMEATKKYKEDYRSTMTLQREGYESDIKKMIKVTAGAELCATHTKVKPHPTDCIKAIDKTYTGDVDLTSRVLVGEPVQKSPFEWRVPYNVMDDAGNSADTAWRDVIVEEVSLDEIEAKIRREVLASKDEEIKEAVASALEKEKMNALSNNEKGQIQSRKGQTTLANCPPCVCPKDKLIFSDEDCNKRCARKQDGLDYVACRSEQDIDSGRYEQCTDVNPTIRFIFRHLQEALSNSVVLFLVIFTLALMALIILDHLITALFARKSGWYYIGPEDEKKENEMLNAVKYYKAPANIQVDTADSSVPIRSGAAVGGGLFSPRQNRVYGQQRDKLFHEGNGSFMGGPITTSDRTKLYK